MTTIEETKSILRRIIYVTIFCFVIYGITSIGILVDKSRTKTSVSLSTALILLAILISFLVIFTVIICVWRRGDQSIKSRQRGGDEEQLYTTSPGGNRYIRTDPERRAIKRTENYERRRNGRRRSIWDRNHHADGRIKSRQFPCQWDAKDERGNPIREPGPLETHSGCKSPTPFAERQEPLIEHSSSARIFSGRLAHGAGLNLNQSRSPSASLRSASQVFRDDGKSTHPEKVYQRPENSEYKPEIFEAWERSQKYPELQAQEQSTYAFGGQIRKEGDFAETGYTQKEAGSSASDYAQGTEKSRLEERSGQEKKVARPKVHEGNMAIPSPFRSYHSIPRKEVGTLSRADRGCLEVTLHDGAGPILNRDSGVTIGYGGERIIIGPGRLPSKLVGHGLIAVPTVPSQAYLNSSEGRMVRRSHAGHESWRKASGFYASRTDGILSMVSEDKSESNKDSERNNKSWGEMTADEVQEQRKQRKRQKQQQKRKEGPAYKPYVPGGVMLKPRPLVVKNGTPAPSPQVKQNPPTQPIDGTEPKVDINSHQNFTESVNRSPSGIYRKTQQEHDRLDKESWLHRSSSFHADKQHTQYQLGDGRKRSNTYHHLSALPDSLKLSPKQPALKKPKLLEKELKIATPQHKHSRGKMKVFQGVKEEGIQASLSDSASTGSKPYVVQAEPMTEPDLDTTASQKPAFLEGLECETDQHRQKRVKEWTKQNEAEKAHRELMAALQPIQSDQAVHHPILQTRKPSPTPAPRSFADWQNRYKFNARRRGVSGFTSVSPSTTTSFFPSYEEIEQERKEIAAEAERRKFSQFMARARNLSGSEIERMADWASPMDSDKLARNDRVTGEQREKQKRTTTMEFNMFNKDASISPKPAIAVNSLPNQVDLEEAKLAQENKEWARKNHEAGSKLEIRSLHSTERGTTFSSFRTVAKVSTRAPQGKSGIPRLTIATGSSKRGAIATSQGRHKPLVGQFEYNSGKKSTPDSRNQVATTKEMIRLAKRRP